jgi:hypothetical protein
MAFEPETLIWNRRRYHSSYHSCRDLKPFIPRFAERSSRGAQGVMTIGRIRQRENHLRSMAFEPVVLIWTRCRYHQGPQSCGLHTEAGHMTAPDRRSTPKKASSRQLVVKVRITATQRRSSQGTQEQCCDDLSTLKAGKPSAVNGHGARELDLDPPERIDRRGAPKKILAQPAPSTHDRRPSRQPKLCHQDQAAARPWNPLGSARRHNFWIFVIDRTKNFRISLNYLRDFLRIIRNRDR